MLAFRHPCLFPGPNYEEMWLPASLRSVSCTQCAAQARAFLCTVCLSTLAQRAWAADLIWLDSRVTRGDRNRNVSGQSEIAARYQAPGPCCSGTAEAKAIRTSSNTHSRRRVVAAEHEPDPSTPRSRLGGQPSDASLVRVCGKEFRGRRRSRRRDACAQGRPARCTREAMQSGRQQQEFIEATQGWLHATPARRRKIPPSAGRVEESRACNHQISSPTPPRT